MFCLHSVSGVHFETDTLSTQRNTQVYPFSGGIDHIPSNPEQGKVQKTEVRNQLSDFKKDGAEQGVQRREEAPTLDCVLDEVCETGDPSSASIIGSSQGLHIGDLWMHQEPGGIFSGRSSQSNSTCMMDEGALNKDEVVGSCGEKCTADQGQQYDASRCISVCQTRVQHPQFSEVTRGKSQHTCLSHLQRLQEMSRWRFQQRRSKTCAGVVMSCGSLFASVSAAVALVAVLWAASCEHVK